MAKKKGVQTSSTSAAVAGAGASAPWLANHFSRFAKLGLYGSRFVPFGTGAGAGAVGAGSAGVGAAGAGGAGIGLSCAAIVVALLAAIAVIVAVIAAISWYQDIRAGSAAGTSQTQTSVARDGIESSASPDSSELGSAGAVNFSAGPSTYPRGRSNSSASRDGDFDEWQMKTVRERILEKDGITAYNNIIEVHRAEYRRRGIDPCVVGAFPQGCASAAAEQPSDARRPSGDTSEHSGSRQRDSSRGSEDLEDREATPQTQPEAFEPVRGAKGKRNKKTGEIWELDQLHKDHYEIYRNRRDYENGRRDRSVWDDGRQKQIF